MNTYHIYIFDLDGTLLDTLGDLAASTNYALRSHSMAERSLDEVRRFVGNGVQKLIERAVPEGTAADVTALVLDTFRQHYLIHSLDTTRPYDGIIPMLTALKARGCRLAVVSNKFHAATQELCRHFFPGLIEVAIGEHEAEGIRKKPAPDTVVEALRRLGYPKPSSSVQQSSLSVQQPSSCEQQFSPSDAVYVGDSDVDVLTARNSGLPCISVLWGFRDRQFLVDHGATTFAESPADLL